MNRALSFRSESPRLQRVVAVELHGDAFKKEATSTDAAIAGTDVVDARFSPVATANTPRTRAQTHSETRVRASPTPLQDAASDLEGLFHGVKEFEMLLDKTAVKVHKLTEDDQEFRSVTEASAIKAIKERMERNMDEVWKMAHTMTEKLKKMILDSFETNRKDTWCEIHACGTVAMGRSSMRMVIALKNKLQETKNDLQNLRNTIREEYQEVVQLRVFAVTGTKLSDEVIRVIEVGSIVQILENASKGIGREKIIAATVEEIKERHGAVMDFDKKLIESHQVFANMEERIVTQEKAHHAVSIALKEVRRIETRLNDVEIRLEHATSIKGLLFALVVFPLAFILPLWIYVATR